MIKGKRCRRNARGDGVPAAPLMMERPAGLLQASTSLLADYDPLRAAPFSFQLFSFQLFCPPPYLRRSITFNAASAAILTARLGSVSPARIRGRSEGVPI
jgi:hypothetical protein